MMGVPVWSDRPCGTTGCAYVHRSLCLFTDACSVPELREAVGIPEGEHSVPENTTEPRKGKRHANNENMMM